MGWIFALSVSLNWSLRFIHSLAFLNKDASFQKCTIITEEHFHYLFLLLSLSDFYLQPMTLEWYKFLHLSRLMSRLSYSITTVLQHVFVFYWQSLLKQQKCSAIINFKCFQDLLIHRLAISYAIWCEEYCSYTFIFNITFIRVSKGIIN